MNFLQSGGQNTGNSCYFLRLGNDNIILDAGKQNNNIPNIGFLKEVGFINDFAELNRVFISHSHLDHIGFLPLLIQLSPSVSLYMTELTKFFTNLQLLDRHNSNVSDNVYRILSDCKDYSYLEKISINNYSVTFLPAGHIPSATMFLFEYGKRNILYTGDYSINSTFLTKSCYVPSDIRIDTLIICGLYAKKLSCNKSLPIKNKIETIREIVINKSEIACCRVSQLTKGIEFLKALNENNKEFIDKLDIYIDFPIYEAVEKLEKAGIPILTQYNHLINGRLDNKPKVILASSNLYCSGMCKEIYVDFSLHDDFNDIITFIKQINPKYAYVVHCANEKNKDDFLNQVLLSSPESRTQAIFAENNEIYKL